MGNKKQVKPFRVRISTAGRAAKVFVLARNGADAAFLALEMAFGDCDSVPKGLRVSVKGAA